MTISDILEHWATIYKPLSHNPESNKLEDQRFFRIRYIDLENIFTRNANSLHSPLMLQSVISTGKLKSAKQSEVSHQVWMVAKVKDTMQSLGRFSGLQIEQTANELMEHCELLASWLIEVKRTGKCPVTGRSFADDPQLMAELKALDVESISYGGVPDLFNGQWLIAGIDWKSIKPLYNFSCGSDGKYRVPNAEDSDVPTSPEP